MTDAEMVERAMAGEYVGDKAALAAVLVAEIERRRDEADDERLARRERDGWLWKIKAAIPADWRADRFGSWDGSACGLPAVVAAFAADHARMSDLLYRIAAETLVLHHSDDRIVGVVQGMLREEGFLDDDAPPRVDAPPADA